MCRHTEPTENGSGVGDVKPQRSDELATCRVPRINEIIVVPLKEVVAVLNQNDAVENWFVQDLALVEDNFANVVTRLCANHGKIALVQQRVHADAVGDRVGGRPTQLRWSEECPHSEEDSGGNDDSGNLRWV
jgi:hypothetical protein